MRELRYAVRSLLRTRAVTGPALIVLALGIGATAAIFTVANAVLFRPLPFADPARLVQFGTVGVLEFQAYREQSRSFESLAAYTTVNKNLLPEGGEPERVTAVAAEAGLFDLLGVSALTGRVFSAADPANVAVVSEGFWRRRFAGRSFQGWTIVLDGERYTVIGVMPQSFQFPYSATRSDLWLPSPLPRTNSWFQRIDAAVGRMRPGVTLEGVRAELAAVAQRIAPLSQSNPGRDLVMMPLTEAVVGRSRTSMLTLLGAVAMVLLIACANVANLLLARAESLRREVAVRVALGAGRARLLRQFLTESLVLAAVASALALLIAAAGTRLLVTFGAAPVPRAAEIGLDLTTLAAVIAIGVTAAVVFGLAPALHAMTPDVGSVLSAISGRSSLGPRRRVVNRALVVGEIALAFVLLTGAGLLLRAFVSLEQAPAGIDARNVLTFRIESRGFVAPESQPAGTSGASTAQGRYFQRIEERVAQIPGVRAAGLVTRLHIQSPGNVGQFRVEGQSIPPALARMREATPGYFRALGIPVRAGTDSGNGIVVNETLVSSRFRGQDPVGRSLDRGTITGVIGDVRQSLRLPAEPEIYAPLSRTSYSAATLVVKADVPAEPLVAAVRAAIREVNPNQPVFDVRTMDAVVAAAHADVSLSLVVIGSFAALAFVLSTAGLYGVLAFAVTARRKELAIRVALGADAARLLRLVFAQGGVLIVSGVAVGIAGALMLTRFLRTLLYEVTPTDPVTFAGAATLLILVALLACLNPARRATRVEPIAVLRHD